MAPSLAFGSQRMPSQKSPRRITRKAVSPAGLGKRRNLKQRKPSTAAASSDALLIAQFAEALGHMPRKRRPTPRRSLTEALNEAAHQGNVIDIMPGAHISTSTTPSIPGHEGSEPIAPCVAAHRRRRLHRSVSGAASWCITLVVTAGIISAAAFGIVSHAPISSAAPITTASAAQF